MLLQQNFRLLAPVLLLLLGSSFGCDAPDFEARAALAPPPGENCVYLCREDIVPKKVDCQAEEEGLEFLLIDNFEYRPSANSLNPEENRIRTTEYFYQYDDRSGEFREPIQTWNAPAREMQRCEGEDTNYAFNVRGGPFMAWGGGFGTNVGHPDFRDFRRECRENDLDCHEGLDPDFEGYTINLTEWEGISFWGRRGPDGQPSIRVGVVDKYTDDDLAYIDYLEHRHERTPPYCRRFRECGCISPSVPCTHFEDHRTDQEIQQGQDDLTGTWCFDPEKDPTPREMVRAHGQDSGGLNVRGQHLRCGQTACDMPYPVYPDREDPEFQGKPCTLYEFAGGIRDFYCFDPETDRPPPNPNELCGDFWIGVAHLTPEWKFYKIPFTEMLQQGWAMQSWFLDLASVSHMRFMYGAGWIDYWIDDVSFYRRKRND